MLAGKFPTPTDVSRLFANLRIVLKILVAPAITTTLMVSLWAIATTGLRDQAQTIDSVVNESFRSALAANALFQQAAEIQSNLFRLLVWQNMDRKPAILERVYAENKDRIAQLRPKLNTLESRVGRPEAAIMTKIARLTRDFQDAARGANRIAYGDPALGSGVVVNAASQYDTFRATMESFQERAETRAQRRAAQAVTDAQALTRLLGVVVVADMVVAVALTVLISRHISRDIRRLARTTTRLAAGELDVAIDEQQRRDEIGDMVWALAVLRTSELEKRRIQVEREASHRRVQESLAYAERMQRAALPRPEAASLGLADLAVLWEPRDEVGGDVYYLARRGRTTAILVMDCTGHGVPGALIGFSALAAADRIITLAQSWRPRTLLRALDRNVRLQLHRTVATHASDDGLEAGLAIVDHSRDELRFAGVGIHLFAISAAGVTTYRAARGGIGYRSQAMPREVKRIDIPQASEASFIMPSDGLLDQPGGERRQMLGRRRFAALLADSFAAHGDLETGLTQFQSAFDSWQGLTPRFDDCSLVAFRPGKAG